MFRVETAAAAARESSLFVIQTMASMAILFSCCVQDLVVIDAPIT